MLAGERGPVVRGRVARIIWDESSSDDSMPDSEYYEDIVTGESLPGGYAAATSCP